MMITTYYQSVLGFLKKYRLDTLADVAIFAIITITFHYIWWNGLVKFLHNFMAFQKTEGLLTEQVFVQSAWVLEYILQFPIRTSGHTIIMENNGAVEVVGSCSGLKQFYQWVILMLLFPGPWKKKLWYIPLGIIIIHMVNVMRIVILCMSVIYWPDKWNLLHDWILRPFFYVVIFSMWVIWVEKLKGPSVKKKTAKINAD